MNVRSAHPQPETHLKPRIPIITGAVFALLGLIGCVTPFRAPPDLAHINLERADSPVVMIEKVWLERKKGELFLTGSAIKRLGATDTTQTHLDVTFFDASGRVLRSFIEHFDPRQIPYGHRIHGHSQYRVALGPLPPATARIEVRAHEGGTASPHD